MLYSKSYCIMPATPIKFGVGISEKLGETAVGMGCKSALVITDKVILELGVIDKAVKSLEAAGVSYEIFPDAMPNTSVSIVRRVAELIGSGKYDLIIGAGGGSALDLAKAGRLFEAHPNAFTQCNLMAGGSFLPRTSRYKLIALPTLSGSGCEYMPGAVILNDETHEKVTLSAGDLAPDIAIIDPVLQLNVPASVTSASAVDSICHAFNKICAPGCEFQYRNVLSLDAVKAIWDKLPVIVHEKLDDIEARSAICYGAIMSGYIMGGPSGNFNHPVAHTISRFFEDVPHGIACAWALPITLRHILPECSEQAKLALVDICGVDRDSQTLVEDIVAAFIGWLKGVGIVPPSKWQSPISHEDWMSIVPYVKEDSVWGMNKLGNYPDDETLKEYLNEAYFDLD